MSPVIVDKDEIHKRIFNKTNLEGNQVDCILLALKELGLIQFKPKEPSIVDILRSVHIQLASEIGEKIYGHMTEACAIAILRELACNNIRPMKVPAPRTVVDAEAIRLAKSFVLTNSIVEVSIKETTTLINVIKSLLNIIEPPSAEPRRYATKADNWMA